MLRLDVATSGADTLPLPPATHHILLLIIGDNLATTVDTLIPSDSPYPLEPYILLKCDATIDWLNPSTRKHVQTTERILLHHLT